MINGAAVGAAAIAPLVGSQMESTHRLIGLGIGVAAILLLLSAAAAHIIYLRIRQHAESEDRRLTEGQLGNDRYWGTVVHWSLPRKQVDALHEPLLKDASTPDEIAQTLSSGKYSGTLQVIERTLLEPDPDILVSWLQERASWMHTIPRPVAQKWNQLSMAVVLIGKGFIPLRVSVEGLALHLAASVGVAVVIREPKKGSAMEKDGLLMLVTSAVLPVLALMLLVLTPRLKWLIAPGPGPDWSQKLKDMGTPLDADSTIAGPVKLPDGGEPTDGGKRAGSPAAKAPDDGPQKDHKPEGTGQKKEKGKGKEKEPATGKPHSAKKKEDKKDENKDEKRLSNGGPAANPPATSPAGRTESPVAGKTPSPAGASGGGGSPAQTSGSAAVPTASKAPGAPPSKPSNSDGGTARGGDDAKAGGK